jgi:hypothetical protein
MNGHGAGSDGAADLGREVERLSGDLLEGRVPSADAPTPPASPPAAPTTPVDVIAPGLDDISADLHAIDVLTQPPAPTGPSAAEASAAISQRVVNTVVAGVTSTDPGPPPPGSTGPGSAEGLRTVSAMTTHASTSLAEPLEKGASFGARHGRNLAVAGIAVVALAAFIGALLALQGGGGAPGTPADPAAVAQASAASPVEPSPVEPSPVEPSDAAPSDDPTLDPTPTSEPTPTPTPTPANVTIRGPIDASEMSGVGLRVGVHEALLGFDPKGGPVSGTFTIEIKEFPIGSLLTRTFGGEKDADYAEFKKCTVTMALVGKVNGNYAADTGKLSGKATFRAQTDDVDDCLKTRPSNISIDPDKVAKPTTVKWRAKFNGTRATGSLDMEPVMDFTATLQD